MPAAHHHTHNRANMYGLARHAGHYERLAAVLAAPLYRRVARDVASAGLQAGAVVLDVGTGPGLVPLRIACRSPELSVIGVDLSAEMIDRATAAADREGYRAERPTFQVADVAALPFPDASIDLVVSSISMHHWEDTAAGLREVARVLRPGAQAWIYDFKSTVTRSEKESGGLDAAVRVEIPLTGTWRVNPIGRLVIRRLG